MAGNIWDTSKLNEIQERIRECELARAQQQAYQSRLNGLASSITAMSMAAVSAGVASAQAQRDAALRAQNLSGLQLQGLQNVIKQEVKEHIRLLDVIKTICNYIPELMKRSGLSEGEITYTRQMNLCEEILKNAESNSDAADFAVQRDLKDHEEMALKNIRTCHQSLKDMQISWQEVIASGKLKDTEAIEKETQVKKDIIKEIRSFCR